MSNNIDVLVIDDDKFIQKVICKALKSGGYSARTADNGELGIAEALRIIPNIILLDVEMPGINGYEVCDRLRNMVETKDVPIVFLSSHSSLRERLQGYEVGADDYLIKPFEAEHLLARINVLHKYYEERQELRAQYELAQKTAIIAMTGSSELGQAMNFMERSLGYTTIDETIQGLFDCTDRLSLDCCSMVVFDNQIYWHLSEGTISPLEKELIAMCDRNTRFLDFGSRTIVNYPIVSLLVKNMPLDDPERYGRLKDLLPILVSGANTKINVLRTQESLTQQSGSMLESSGLIRSNLYHLASTILKNRDHSTEQMENLVQSLSGDLMRMGLEEDQEEYLLNRIDTAIQDVMAKMDAGKELREGFSFILSNLNMMMKGQKALLEAFNSSQASESLEQSDELDDSIELF